MKSEDNVGVTFVNTVVGRGSLNGVINLTLGVYNFTPNDKEVDADLAINCRLRMDLQCARELRNVLNELLPILEAEQVAPAETPPEEDLDVRPTKRAAN